MPQLYGGPTSPNGATVGDQWTSSRDGKLRYYDGGRWVQIATATDPVSAPARVITIDDVVGLRAALADAADGKKPKDEEA